MRFIAQAIVSLFNSSMPNTQQIILPFTSPISLNPPSFPPEVADRIIDHLYADDITLRACSLTCRDWMQSCRYHLFGCVTLTPKSAPKALLIPALARTVYHLVIEDIDLRFPLNNQMQGSHVLQAGQICTWGIVAQSFGRIRHLELVHFKLARFSGLIPLAYSFPHLDTLTIRRPEWRPGVPSTEELSNAVCDLERPFHLRIEVDDSCALAMKIWLDSCQAHLLGALHFHIHKLQSYHAMRDLIRTHGHSLMELRFDLTFALNIKENTTDFLDIRFCANLRRLHIDNILLFPGFRMSKLSTSWISLLLAQAVGSFFEDVTFTIRLHTEAGMDCMNWPEICGSLSRLPSLKTVTVRFVELNLVDSEQITHLLRSEHLQHFHHQKMLRVEFPQDDADQ